MGRQKQTMKESLPTLARTSKQWIILQYLDTLKYCFILQILILRFFRDITNVLAFYWYCITGGQEQQSMKEILATLARTSEGGDQLPSYEGVPMSLLNIFDYQIYPSDIRVLFKVTSISSFQFTSAFHGQISQPYLVENFNN